MTASQTFDTLYMQYSQLVLSVVGRTLRGRGATCNDQEDISQRIWLEVHQHLQAGGLVTKSWLMDRAQSRAVDHIRTLGRRAEDSLESMTAAEEDGGDSFDVGADETIDRWRDPAVREVLAALIEQLPAQPRRAVELRFFAGLPVADVAREMGVGVGTATKYISRGVAGLRDRLTSAGRKEAA